MNLPIHIQQVLRSTTRTTPCHATATKYLSKPNGQSINMVSRVSSRKRQFFNTINKGAHTEYKPFNAVITTTRVIFQLLATRRKLPSQ